MTSFSNMDKLYVIPVPTAPIMLHYSTGGQGWHRFCAEQLRNQCLNLWWQCFEIPIWYSQNTTYLAPQLRPLYLRGYLEMEIQWSCLYSSWPSGEATRHYIFGLTHEWAQKGVFNKANLRDLIAATVLVFLLKIGFKSLIFGPMWPGNLMEDFKKQ